MNENDWSIAEAWNVMGLDNLHPLLFAELADLAAVADTQFKIRFRNFVAELEHDFSREEQFMEENRFASLKEHRQAHAELLRLLHHAQERLETDEYKLARKIVGLLPHWFIYHMTTMDLAFANATRVQLKLREVSQGTLRSAA